MPTHPSEFGTQPPTAAELKQQRDLHQNNPVEHPDYPHAPFPRALYKDDPEKTDGSLLTLSVADKASLQAKVAEGWRETPNAPVPA